VAAGVARGYFRDIRPELVQLTLPTETFDAGFSGILNLSNEANRKRSYSKLMAVLHDALVDAEIAREIRLGEVSWRFRNLPSGLTPQETHIYETLHQMLPGAARSYHQALRDLSDPTRLSFRGTASELRETLREVVDHLAPDDEVRSSPGFRLEDVQKRPTMKQKVRFLLRARGQPESSRKVAEESTGAIEEITVGASRSAYDRVSVSVHSITTKEEILTLKRYLEAVLSELLEVPA
jgi:hypothetical protein